MVFNDYHRKTIVRGIRAWYIAEEEWQRTATPEQKAKRDALAAHRKAELDAHIAWLDWCAKNNTHPKG